MERHFYDLPIRVLIYHEDREFVAHALEMDLLGYGKSERAACENLSKAIASQISFAARRKEAGLIDFRAPQEFFDRWEKAQTAILRGEATGDLAAIGSAKALAIGFQQSTIKRRPKKQQARKDVPALA